MSDPQTRAFYDAEAAAYADRFAKQRPLKTLADFGALLPKGARVLDLGCGAGQDAAALRDMGFEMSCVDASEGLAAIARERFGLDVRVMSFADLDDRDSYDAVWANASLHHAAANALPGIFSRIHHALKPGGLLAASLKEGADRRDSLGRFYCAMNEAQLRALVRDFEIDSLERREGGGYDDVAVPWLMLRARKLR